MNQSTQAVQAAVEALVAGGTVVVVDSPDRENAGDLVMAGTYADRVRMSLFVRHTTGIICAPMPQERAEALHLPPMVPDNADPHDTAFTVSVDPLRTGTATDRARTVLGRANQPTPENVTYLTTKRDRMGHLMDLPNKALAR
ncbi:3,4-dihydroxy-2-butanone-4-phosphate synthase [Streptomyces sp. NPDC054919]